MVKAIDKLARRCLRLSEFVFDVVHSAGIKQQAADELSRLKTKGEEVTPLNDEVPVLTTS